VLQAYFIIFFYTKVLSCDAVSASQQRTIKHVFHTRSRFYAAAFEILDIIVGNSHIGKCHSSAFGVTPLAQIDGLCFCMLSFFVVCISINTHSLHSQSDTRHASSVQIERVCHQIWLSLNAMTVASTVTGSAGAAWRPRQTAKFDIAGANSCRRRRRNNSTEDIAHFTRACRIRDKMKRSRRNYGPLDSAATLRRLDSSKRRQKPDGKTAPYRAPRINVARCTHGAICV
jgi:hypothetical protein